MELPVDSDGYVPRIKFTDDPEKLAIMTLNRHQNRFDLYMANPRSAICKVAIRDEAEQYIKEQAYLDIAFYPEHIVMMSERDGYNHLYLYTIGGNLVKQITKGEFEVKDFRDGTRKQMFSITPATKEAPCALRCTRLTEKVKRPNFLHVPEQTVRYSAKI